MKRKLLACFLAVLMLFGTVPVAHAEDNVAAILYDEEGNVEKTLSEEDFSNPSNAITLDEQKLVLQQDVTIPLMATESMVIGMQAASNSTLDLNGYTLTFSSQNLETGSSSILGAIAVVESGDPSLQILNGKIVIDVPDGELLSSYAIVRMKGSVVMDNVELTTASENQKLSAAVYGIVIGTEGGDFGLENCVFDESTNKILDTMLNDTDMWPESDTFNIHSGSYPAITEDKDDHISIPEGSKKLEKNPTGVTGSVITSEATTAMIVKDGHAYLYDSLQDAVNALPDGEETPTVYLMKESDETVTLPPDTPLKLDTDYAGENGFKGTMQDENGVTLTPSEDGTYESIAVTGVTLSQNSLSLTVGESATLTATVTPANATAQTVTWSSSNPDVASVDQNGLVKALREGSATITASVGGQSAACTVSVKEPPYTGKYSYEVFTSVGDNGSLTVDRYATEGDKVTIEVTPDEAYLLDELVVTANGKEVELTDNGDGTYTFTMPSADVRISATFAEDPDWTEPEEPATDVSDIFIDVAPNAWYKDAVQYAYAGGLMTGVSANEFAPDATTTRGMIVSMLARLEGVESANDAGFADVSDEWYATAVNWAASVGVVNGYEDGTFRPNDAITREQLAAILMNYAAYKGEDVSARASLDAYSDAENVSTWATDTMSWAVAEGYITGMTADTLQPQGSATRAQVAAILERYLAE